MPLRPQEQPHRLVRHADRRQAGVEPGGDGVDVVTRAGNQDFGEDESAPLSQTALDDLPLKPTPELVPLLYQPPEGDWQLTHDRCLVPGREPAAIWPCMRMMVQGTDAGAVQHFRAAEAAPAKLPTLEQFQDDVRHALGKNFGTLVEAAELPSETNYRIYRVVVKGEVSEVPIQWHYYLVADEHGRRASFAFTVKEQNLGRLHEAGERLVRACASSIPRRLSRRSSFPSWNKLACEAAPFSRATSRRLAPTKNSRRLGLHEAAALGIKPPADCDWMRRCETSEGRACYCTSPLLTLADANGLAPPSE